MFMYTIFMIANTIYKGILLKQLSVNRLLGMKIWKVTIVCLCRAFSFARWFSFTEIKLY